MIKLTLSLTAILLLILGSSTWAHQPRVVYYQQGNIQINSPENSQAFYDELNGKPRDYFINSDKDFELYVSLMVPEAANRAGKYSANIFSMTNSQSEAKPLYSISDLSDWSEYYESFGRDYYLKGPEFDKNIPAGKYKIEVFSLDNQGKYVLVAGKQEAFSFPEILNIYWQLPLLKITFFKTSVLQFFLTSVGISSVAAVGLIIILFLLLDFFIFFIKEKIHQNAAKTILLTSAGMQMKDEIIKLLQKPAYDITVAFITTAAKQLENVDFVKKDWDIMKELGFNIEEVDIEDKKESEVIKLLELKDIIFVEGGNTSYLLRAMQKCNFEKIIKKLLKEGKVYIGAGEGSVVAGKKGLNLVSFDIFVHYQSEHAEIIKKKLPWKWLRKKLRILTDDQAILVQGREVMLIGKGEKIIF